MLGLEQMGIRLSQLPTKLKLKIKLKLSLAKLILPHYANGVTVSIYFALSRHHISLLLASTFFLLALMAPDRPPIGISCYHDNKLMPFLGHKKIKKNISIYVAVFRQAISLT